ncbi:MAG TPA: twin-arginine translocase TatA/TatE family subunit [Candidatus Saccharimonadales bacterium]|jgi:sec-independent protein translocase protein TatA|nr:twin-arginine translocase TatA/TatE family subunit [Candidatus Saccharimonadales bacterium]
MEPTQFADILGLGTPELLIILVILLLLFGGSKLPQLSRSIGSSVKELRKSMSGDASDDKKTAQSTNSSQNRD